MANVKYKKRKRHRLFLVIFFIIAILYAGTVLIQQELKFHAQRELKAELNRQIVETKDKNEDLSRQVEYSKTDEYVEKIVREKFGWVKPDEIRFVQKKD